jgi:hypothetical protein
MLHRTATARPVIVYGGDTDQPRRDIPVVSWRHLHRALDQMLGDAERPDQASDTPRPSGATA